VPTIIFNQKETQIEEARESNFAYPAYKAFACPSSEDKHCQTPTLYAYNRGNCMQTWTLTLPYRAEDLEVAKFCMPQIKRRSTSYTYVLPIRLNKTESVVKWQHLCLAFGN
jgi:hypothetical protein